MGLSTPQPTPQKAAEDPKESVGDHRSAGLNAPIDLEHLTRYTLSDRNLEREILGLFCSQLPISLEALKQAKSPKEWKIAAHTVKGSARAIGAWRLANIAAVVEQAAYERVGTQEEARLLKDLADAADEVTDYIVGQLDGLK